MEVLDLRTYRDLQYVRNTESLMKVVDGKLKVASENPRSLNPKGFQVIGCRSPLVHTVQRVHMLYCQLESRCCGWMWRCTVCLCAPDGLRSLSLFTDNNISHDSRQTAVWPLVHKFNSKKHLLVIESCAEEIWANSHAPELLSCWSKKGRGFFFLYSSLYIILPSLLTQPLFLLYILSILVSALR